MKISVLTATMRDDRRLRKQRDFLEVQTMNPHDFEWIITDDFKAEREEMVWEWGPSTFNIVHVNPYKFKDYGAPNTAANTGILLAAGELLYMMTDYMRITPGVLQRHWEIYQEYGPDVAIAGPYKPGPGNPDAPDRPIDLSVADGLGEVTDIKNIGGRFWAGRNDSVPLQKALDVNGYDERFDGVRAGTDVIFGMKLISSGCRWLIDQLHPAYDEFPHSPHRKGLSDEEWKKMYPGLVWQDVFKKASEGDTWTPNEINLRERRKELWGILA